MVIILKGSPLIVKIAAWCGSHPMKPMDKSMNTRVFMKTEAEALTYIKNHTFNNEAGGSYHSGEHIDEAIVILDKMVDRQRKALNIVNHDVAKMRIELISIVVTVLASVGFIAYILPNIDNPSKWIFWFALLLAVLLSIRTYSFYTQYYKTAIQERRRLIESINDNTLIQVNF